MQQIELIDAQLQLANLVNAALSGEEIILTKDHQPIARIVPMEAPKSRIEPGSAKGLVWIADDFDAQLDDFKEYAE